jgi:hypothetical protein
MTSQLRARPIQVGIDDTCRSTGPKSETALSRKRTKQVRVSGGDHPDRLEWIFLVRLDRPTILKCSRLCPIDPAAGLHSLCTTSIETCYPRVRTERILIFSRPKTNPDSGASINLIHEQVCSFLSLPVTPYQGPKVSLADGSTILSCSGVV